MAGILLAQEEPTRFAGVGAELNRTRHSRAPWRGFRELFGIVAGVLGLQAYDAPPRGREKPPEPGRLRAEEALHALYSKRTTLR
jgi:hypothetical protein